MAAYLHQFGSFPAFMGALTLDLFSRTTMITGRR